MPIDIPEYRVYMVACPAQPSGHTPTVEQIMAGECGEVLRGRPDFVSNVATISLVMLLATAALLAILRLFNFVMRKLT